MFHVLPLSYSLISPVSSFSPEPSASPRRERKKRSGRVPPPTPSSSLPKCCFNSSILPGKAFSYRSSLILVDHCTRSHQRGNPRVHPAFPALLGAAQNRGEFGRHGTQSDSARSSLRRFAVRFFFILFMLFLDRSPRSWAFQRTQLLRSEYYSRNWPMRSPAIRFRCRKSRKSRGETAIWCCRCANTRWSRFLHTRCMSLRSFLPQNRDSARPNPAPRGRNQHSGRNCRGL